MLLYFIENSPGAGLRVQVERFERGLFGRFGLDRGWLES